MKIAIKVAATIAAVQSDLVTAIRNQIRDSPIRLDNGWLVDADRDSVITMDETIAEWDNITFMKTPTGEQMWKDSDNQIRLMNRDQFAAFVDEVHRKRAERLDANFAFAEIVRSQLPLADNHPALSPEGWPG